MKRKKSTQVKREEHTHEEKELRRAEKQRPNVKRVVEARVEAKLHGEEKRTLKKDT